MYWHSINNLFIFLDIALLRNNAKNAAMLAQHYSNVKNSSNNNNNGEKVIEKPLSSRIKSGTLENIEVKKPKVLTVGAAIVDFEVITDEMVKVSPS